jgi:histone-lysine N-methyltransferase SETMAR
MDEMVDTKGEAKTEELFSSVEAGQLQNKSQFMAFYQGMNFRMTEEVVGGVVVDFFFLLNVNRNRRKHALLIAPIKSSLVQSNQKSHLPGCRVKNPKLDTSFGMNGKKKTSEAAANINQALGEDSVKLRLVQYWYKRFNEGDESCEDEPRSGRPNLIDDDEIKVIIENQQSVSLAELAEVTGHSPSGVWTVVHRLGFKSKLNKWVPHQLSDFNVHTRLTICQKMLARHQKESFLDRIVTCDEKCIYHDNSARERSWGLPGQAPKTTAKRGLTQKKVLLSVWWDCRGILLAEFLPSGQTINSGVYCGYLQKLDAELKNKRPALVNRKGVILHQDNAKPHTSKVTKKFLQELGYELLEHPPYSPDLAPSDYYLFRSLQNHLRGAKFTSSEEAKNEVISFFASKSEDYFKKGIFKLVDRWSNVIRFEGEYLDD